jgi:hypothetical protein
MKMWSGNAVFVLALVCAAAIAEAADSPSLVTTKDPMVAPSAFDWSGAYFGGHFSYSLKHTTTYALWQVA